ncbi:Maf1 regulator-domain-containing protein [Pilobolus umbonatus]|nr:Maf1 regulator-domain-containing protein [Pilobolus umbonatus]
MKFLEVDSLDVINTAFRWETAECILTGRVEAYSCKSAGHDKKLFKTLENRYNADLLAPGSISPEEVNVISPFGRLTESTPRKTFFYLLATLNAAFPDNDFEDVRPDQFIKLPSVDLVINSVNTTLFNLGNDLIVNKYRLWDVLDEIVQLNECDVYTYNPDVDDDPMNEEEGFLWSMNYFFFNRKLKRMVFFSTKSESMNAPTSDNDEDGEDDGSRRYQDEFSMEDMEV